MQRPNRKKLSYHSLYAKKTGQNTKVYSAFYAELFLLQSSKLWMYSVIMLFMKFQ